MGLDLILSNGKGVPLGGFVSMFAEPAIGKSTVLIDMARKAIKRQRRLGVPFKVAYLDTEGSYNLLLDMGLGEFIESGELIYIEDQITFASLQEFYDKILIGEGVYKDIKFVIIDSATTITTESKLERGVEEADFGIVAKAATEFYKRYAVATRSKITTFLINQVRDNQNSGYGQSDKAIALSNAGKFYSHTIMHLSKKTGSQNKDVQEKYLLTLDVSSEMHKCKGRFGRLPSIDVLIKYGKQTFNAHTLREMLVGLGFVSESSGYYIVLDDKLSFYNKGKKLRRPEINKLVSQNEEEIKNFFKERDLYKVSFDHEGEDEDGFLEQ